MNHVFRVKINLELVQSHLAREDQREVSGEEVRRFLLDSGFQPAGDWWTVNEKALGALDPSEVSEAEVLGDDASSLGAALGTVLD
jgi:hypothetical protein